MNEADDLLAKVAAARRAVGSSGIMLGGDPAAERRVPPPRTLTEVRLLSNQTQFRKVKDESGNTTEVQLSFLDPYFNRVITFPMVPSMAEAFAKDFLEFIQSEEVQDGTQMELEL